MKVKRMLIQGASAIVFASLVIGCGGGGATGFNQTLVGNWTQAPTSTNNTTLTILSNGSITGRKGNLTVGGTDILTGSLHSNGEFNGQVVNDVSSSIHYTVHGTIVYQGDTNLLRLTYSGSFDGGPINVDMTLSH